MFKNAIIALLVIGTLGTGVALADSDGDDDDNYGSDHRTVIECQQLAGSGDGEDDHGRPGHECDGEDDDGGTGMSAAPAGSVPPPDNGLFNPDSTPSVRVQ